MPRILGVDLPNEKRVEIALTYLYGVGPTTAKKIVADLGFRDGMRAKELTDEDVAKLASHIDGDYVVEGALRRQMISNVNRLKEVGCYRGLRHRRGLPVRGQRTRCNARTRKGPRRTVANKKIQRK